MNFKFKRVFAVTLFFLFVWFFLGGVFQSQAQGQATQKECTAGLIKCSIAATLVAASGLVALGSAMLVSCGAGYLFCIEFMV